MITDLTLFQSMSRTMEEYLKIAVRELWLKDVICIQLSAFQIKATERHSQIWKNSEYRKSKII